MQVLYSFRSMQGGEQCLEFGLCYKTGEFPGPQTHTLLILKNSQNCAFLTYYIVLFYKTCMDNEILIILNICMHYGNLRKVQQVFESEHELEKIIPNSNPELYNRAVISLININFRVIE